MATKVDRFVQEKFSVSVKQQAAISKELKSKFGDAWDEHQILDAAKSPKSALHSHFEWDDTVAGHQFRLSQARHLMRVIRVEISTGQTVRKFHKVDLTIDGEPTRKYIEYTRVRASKVHRESIVEQARQQLVLFAMSYAKYRDFFRSEAPSLFEVLSIVDTMQGDLKKKNGKPPKKKARKKSRKR